VLVILATALLYCAFF